MTNPQQDKLQLLQRWFDQVDSVLIAYSGGVDSALVMSIAHEQLGKRALACIAVSPSYPAREMRQAVKLAEKRNVPFRLIQTQEHLDERYAENPQNRCYFCKNELFTCLRELAEKEHWHAILDGTNADDRGDDRPGMIAAKERGVRSPLLELGLTKQDVRQLARDLGLPVWDKPAMACLSSRVPHGVVITPQLLRQIETAEDVLFGHGFGQFRVRHHGDVARIELPQEDLSRALENGAALVEGIRGAGYHFVCLDLGGFRSGSEATGSTVHMTVKGQP